MEPTLIFVTITYINLHVFTIAIHFTAMLVQFSHFKVIVSHLCLQTWRAPIHSRSSLPPIQESSNHHTCRTISLWLVQNAHYSNLYILNTFVSNCSKVSKCFDWWHISLNQQQIHIACSTQQLVTSIFSFKLLQCFLMYKTLLLLLQFN